MREINHSFNLGPRRKKIQPRRGTNSKSAQPVAQPSQIAKNIGSTCVAPDFAGQGKNKDYQDTHKEGDVGKKRKFWVP